MRKTFSNTYVSNTILASVVDGVDIINLNDNKTELAMRLNPYIKRKKPFKFLNFEVFSLGRFMLFLSYKDYPISNFTKPYYKKLGKLEKRRYDNYWGIIVVYLLGLVESDKTLLKLLKENNLPFNSYKDSENSNNVAFLGTQVAIKDKVNKLHGYCRCVEYVSNLLKHVDINDKETIRKILDEDFPGIEKTVETLVNEITTALKNENSKSVTSLPKDTFSQCEDAESDYLNKWATGNAQSANADKNFDGDKITYTLPVKDNAVQNEVKEEDFSKMPLENKVTDNKNVSKLYEDESK